MIKFVKLLSKESVKVDAGGTLCLVRALNVDGRIARTFTYVSQGLLEDAQIDLDAILLSQMTSGMKSE
jgi:hypothetical protein